jgi:hypothetical protein
MGVHRTKTHHSTFGHNFNSPTQVQHQHECVICHERFVNALLLHHHTATVHIRQFVPPPINLMTPAMHLQSMLNEIKPTIKEEPKMSPEEKKPRLEEQQTSGQNGNFNIYNLYEIKILNCAGVATSPLHPLALQSPSFVAGTTCNICYKTFACNSALDIHYR